MGSYLATTISVDIDRATRRSLCLCLSSTKLITLVINLECRSVFQCPKHRTTVFEKNPCIPVCTFLIVPQTMLKLNNQRKSSEELFLST